MFDAKTSWLFLDASGVVTRVGVWQNTRWLAWRESDAPALESLFTGTQAVFEESGISRENLGGYIYIEGPGSVLGLRLAAMAIRAWQVDDAAHKGGKARAIFACGSLHLAAALALAGGAQPPFTVFTDARQGLWQVLEVNAASIAELSAATPRETADADLPSGPLFHLPARKAWHQPPARARPLPASLSDHPEILSQPNLLRPVETPAPYAAHAPEYKKWKGERAKGEVEQKKLEAGI